MTNKDFIIASNKFFYFAMNYKCELANFNTIYGEVKNVYVPTFFKAFDSSLWGHLLGKWNNIQTDSYGRVMKFYGMLDGDNRVKMLNWVNENYTQDEGFGLNKELLFNL